MNALLISFLICFSFSSYADIFRGPQSAGMGGTGAAGLSSSESVFVNPALLPLIPGYELMGYFRDGQADAGQHRNAWGATIMDNGNDVALAGAITYLRLRDTGRAVGPVNGELWHATLGREFVNRFSLGASVYKLDYEVARVKTYTQWNGSVGAIWTPFDGFVLGYTLANLALPAGETPLGLREDLKQTLGTNIDISQIVKLRVDVSRRERQNPDKKLDYGIGLESLSNTFLLIRLGYRREEVADQSFWTAGIGFNGPRLRLDYAFEKNQERASGAVHSVDMTLPF